MLRRTFLVITGTIAVLSDRLRGQNRAELNRLAEQQLAATPHKSAQIMKLSSPKLIAILDDPGATEFAKAKACQRLAVVGDDSAVSALTALLGNAKLSHYARTALEPMPGAAADKALLEALESVEGNVLVGVIHSIGSRRDPNALPALARLRGSGDRGVSGAATWAINRIRRP